MPNIKSIFKKEPTPDISSSPSSTGLSKLFHRHDSKKDLNTPTSSTAPSPVPSNNRNHNHNYNHNQIQNNVNTNTTSSPVAVPSPASPHPVAGSTSSPITPPPHSTMRRAASINTLKRRNTNPIQSTTTAAANNNVNHHTKDTHTNGNSHTHHSSSGTNLHAPGFLNRHRSNSEKGPIHPGRKTLSKADTFAHLNQIDTRNAQKQQLRSSRAPSNHASPVGHHGDKIVYNPYGLNKTATQERPKNTSFYMSGINDGERVLANPVASPNDYLPDYLKQTHINLLEDFEIDVGTRKLGDGGSSDVRIINACNNKKSLFALKRFTLLSKETDEEFYKRVLKEYVLHHQASKSRHVVDVIAILRIQSQSNLTRGWGMVMEFCGGGDLFSLIVKPGWKNTSLAEKYCLFKQISYGVKFLHDNDIVHRDLKPENVLLDANGLAKLCDFGVSEFGHETPGDFSSPVKLSTAYVGSPPYSPPEVMLLKEKSSTEIKNFAYDPFKMDCWGLGMMLFCLIYGGVPFQQSSPNDHAFRDYKFSHKRFCTDHHTFKDNIEYPKGPGSEFKLAAKFENTGASRVAWKLCDPSPNTRYNMDMLFADPWFKGLEMCIYEHPDQEVNPFVLPGTGNNVDTHPSFSSGYTSTTNSQVPSRRGTFTSRKVATNNGYDSHDESLHTPIKSMLDLTDVTDKVNKTTLKENSQFLNHNNPPPTTNGNTAATTTNGDVSSSNASLHSLDDTSNKLKSRLDPGVANNAPMINEVLSAAGSVSVSGSASASASASGSSSSSSPMNSAPSSVDKINQAASPVNGNNLPAVEESDIEHEECDSMLALDFKHTNPIPHSPIEEFPSIPIPKKETTATTGGENIPIPVEEVPLDSKIECEPLTEIKDEDEGEQEDVEDDRFKTSLNIPPSPKPNFNSDEFAKESSPSSLTQEDASFCGPAESIISTDNTNKPTNNEGEENIGENQQGFCTLADLKIPVLKEATDLQLNKDGSCELGYKIKKHHHTEVSNVSNTGTRR